MSILQTAALVGSFAASVAAHGRVQGIVAGSVYYEGYNPSFQYRNPPPIVIGWEDPEDIDNGYVAPSNYSSPDIICHVDATPAGIAAKVTAGDTVELQWTTWPTSHHGPVVTYLAKCPGSCSNIDKTTLDFFKIDELGLVSDDDAPGTWASDQLIANNNSWVVEIPKSIASGNYVLRHEIIALHSAGEADGAQNYPQCINLEITSGGSDNPAGTLGEKLYTEKEPGVLINIYTSLSTYQIPGPTLYSGAVSIRQTTVSITGAAPISTGSSTSWVASTSTTTTSRSSSAAAASSASSSSSAAAAPSTLTTLSSTRATTSPIRPTSAPASSPKISHTSVISDISIVTAQIMVTATASSNLPTVSSVTAAYTAESESSTSTATAVLPTTSSSPSGGSGGNGAFSSPPSKPLPDGFTLKDLLEWVDYLLSKSFREGNHQRDFNHH